MPVLEVKVSKYLCGRCGYSWFPKQLTQPRKLPRTCPSCRNAYWNEPRVNKTKNFSPNQKIAEEEINNGEKFNKEIKK